MRRFRNNKIGPLLIPLFSFSIIMIASVAIIAYGRGYRVDLKNNGIKTTGLISATSDPIGAQVYVNGTLRTATNNPVNVDPGWYTINISKEGYIPWQKNVRVQGEVVTRADAFLFPTNPSLSPLTTVGIEHPILSPDGTRIAYVVPASDSTSEKKTGLWIYTLTEGPLGRNRDPQQLGTSDTSFDFSTATVTWSPDSTQILADNSVLVRLYSLNRPLNYQDVTNTKESILDDWENDRQTKERTKLAAFPRDVINMASSSAKIISFSPDETKVLYEATATATIKQVIKPALIGTNSTAQTRDIEPGKIYVYDMKEDKNYFVLDKKELPSVSPTPTDKLRKVATPTPMKNEFAASAPTAALHWFPTSKHLVLTLEGKIDIMEFDRTNWVTVYAGPFVGGFIAPWPNGSRILIMTNLNPNAQKFPNLYTVNLR